VIEPARDLFGVRYPSSLLTGSASDAFSEVLGMHLRGDRVLDATYGTGLSWSGLRLPIRRVCADIDPKSAHVVKQDLFTAVLDRQEWIRAFDVVFYDPPYYFGVDASDDPRQSDYGGYAVTEAQLLRYMHAQADLARFLRPGGKLILKCADQYHVPSRRLYLHHLDWCEHMRKALTIVDFYVYRYHRVSPTAWQVKDRPCAVIGHTYFVVGEKP